MDGLIVSVAVGVKVGVVVGEAVTVAVGVSVANNVILGPFPLVSQTTNKIIPATKRSTTRPQMTNGPTCCFFLYEEIRLDGGFLVGGGAMGLSWTAGFFSGGVDGVFSLIG